MTGSNLNRRRFLGVLAAAAVPLPAENSVAREFAAVPNVSRLRMHWYIFGPAWTSAEARRQLELMVQADVGGVLIFPTYPVAVDDPANGIQNEKYLSPEFLSVLNSVVADAKRLGLTVDIVLGTGWPYGGPSVTLEDSAHSIRMVRAKPALGEGERLIAAFLVDGNVSRQVQEGEDLTGQQGERRWFYSAPTRMEVKRPSLGGEGWIVDHYRESSLQHFLASVGDKLLDSVPRGSIRSVFCDSLEVYRATWTAEFPEIFRRKRGYDLVARLPALFDTDHPDSRDLRCDFWRTLSEQVSEAFVEPLQAWAHRKGVTTQVEAYGTPPVSFAAYRHVDIPVGEHYEWKEFSASRWASSGGHLAGKPVILAEAWTWLGLPNRFADTLEQLKQCSDLHFLSGINSLYGVTYAYSPVELGSPGWVPYFGPAVNHTSPYWPYFSHFADYVNRACYVLQQGKPVADVALYLPAEDAMAEANVEQLLLNWAVRDRISSNGPPPEFSLKNALHYESDVVKGIITNGYSFDGVDPFTMNGGMHVEGGRLRMGDGNYSVIVLPNLTGIDLESLQKIEEFVRGGGTAIATRRLPEKSYGMRDRDQRNAAVKELAERMFGSGITYGSGRAIYCPDEKGSYVKALLAAQTPDIACREPSEHVSFVHRRSPDRDYYFLVNTSMETVRLDGVFRVGRKVPESWDLRTGRIEPVTAFEHVKGGTRVPFELGPIESKVITFSEGSRTPKAPAVRRSKIPEPFVPEISWRLSIEGKPVPLPGLRSWTEIPAIRFFSGRGVYEGEFAAPEFRGLGVILDLGQVRETADVHINGEPAGVAWMRPYRVDITKLLREGANRIRVDVTNLLINKVLGNGPIDYSKVFAQYGRRFPAGDEWEVVREPLPSGLLGPVRLVYY